MAKLTKKKVEKLIKRKELGLPSKLIAEQLGITKQRVNQVWREYIDFGKVILKKPGKLKVRILSEKEQNLILNLHKHQMCGARIIGIILRKKHNFRIGNTLIHSFLLDNKMAEPNEKKQKRRKPWVRYEREHSLSAGHMDWHTTKWCEDLQVCALLDDSSRKILAGIECKNATEEESIKLVKQVIREYGHIRKIRELITDHGTQFFNNTPDKDGELQKNQFQLFLEKQGINHILCRYKHPQTNGKQEKWFDAYERHRKKFSSFQDFIKWYNETRIHESLDYRTPEKVFWERLEPFVWECVGKFFKEEEQ